MIQTVSTSSLIELSTKNYGQSPPSFTLFQETTTPNTHFRKATMKEMFIKIHLKLRTIYMLLELEELNLVTLFQKVARRRLFNGEPGPMAANELTKSKS